MSKKKEDARKKLKRNRSPSTEAKFIELRRSAKEMLMRKKKEHAEKLKASISEIPKCFWSYIKSSTSDRPSPNFLGGGHKLVTDSRDRANILNKFFSSVFNPASTASPPLSALPPSGVGEELDSTELTVSEVREVLLILDANKACGPDNIPGSLLKNTAAKIAPSLCKIFNLSLSHGVVPALWKRADVSSVFKKDDPTLAENYRPISLLCIVSKVLERCVFNHCYPHFAPLLYNLQHGFLRRRSTVTQLLEVYHDILDMVAGGQEVDVIHLDLSKAFDKVPHDLLLTKLHRHGISGTALRWFASYLSNRQQRVVLDGVFSDWLPVTSGVPQGSILGPLLFLVFANEMPSYVQHGSSLALFADDSKLYRPMDSVSSPALLQSDLDGLHSWSSDLRMTFNATECKVLRMSKRRSCRKSLNTYHLGEEVLSHSPETSDLGVSVSGNCTWNSENVSFEYFYHFREFS